jgi:2-aminoadipate transaminase
MTHSAFFENLYASRALEFRPSPVRSVWDVMMEPGIISLAGGNPDLSVLPLDELGKTCQKLVSERGTQVLQYGAGQGTPELRHALSKVMTNSGIEADPDDILVTAGSQMGIHLVTGMLCNPGDVVLAESPTFVGALGTFAGLEADVEHVECDEDGIIPEKLEQKISELRAAGKEIKMLYTIPNFGNPSGVTMSQERRPQVASICRDSGIAVLEDDPYGQLAFSGETPKAIRSYDDSVIYLGSMSKIFSPGIRIGWTVAPKVLRARLQLEQEAFTIHPSMLSENLATEYLTAFDWESILKQATRQYEARATAMLSALDEHMPSSVSWTKPEGGFFIWLTLPDNLDVPDLFDAAVEEKVVFVDGKSFFADGQSTGNHLRLSFSLETPEKITEAIRRLGAAMKALLNG